MNKTNVVRIGFVGLDTSHAVTFAKILQDPFDPYHIPGAKVVAAYPGGSPDMEISISRIKGFTKELTDRYGVRIVDSPEKVADASDLVFILAADGRTHAGLFKSVAGFGKPVFVDKPFSVSVAAAQEIFARAEAAGTPVFATSAFRYADGLMKALLSIREGQEQVRTCCVRCWMPIEETQGRYFWYGIHAAEMLLLTMGPGTLEVRATGDAAEDRISVSHRDGRESSIVGSRHDRTFQVDIETNKRKLNVSLEPSMPSLSARLLWSALDVLTDGTFPRLWSATGEGSVSGKRRGRALDPVPDDTLEIMCLLEAAQQSYASQQRVAVAHCTSADGNCTEIETVEDTKS